MKNISVFIILCFISIDLIAQFGSQQIIDEDSYFVRMVRTADFDQDGDIDIVVSAFDLIAWYENLDGFGSFGEPIPIQEGKRQSFSLFPADVDNDGKIDLVVSFFDDDQIAWYRNLGNGDFSTLNLITSGLLRASGVSAADLDGDGDLDLVLGVSNGNGLYWVQNLDGMGNFSTRVTIDASISGARTQAIGDIDGDGDMDILTNSVGSTYLSWFENVDGLGSFITQHSIDPVGLYENSINLVDIDGDNDLDIVSQKTDLVIWRENIDGLGNFSPYSIVSDQALNIFDTNAADLNNDGTIDIFSASTDDNKIAWYNNEDGVGGFGIQMVIDPDLQSPRTVHAADLDGDGDLDVVSAALSNLGRELVWYENLTILGIAENDLQKDITIYPNPTKNIVSIASGNHTTKNIKVFDALGRLMLEHLGKRNAPNNFNEIDLSAIADGVLLIQIETKEGVLSKKLLKE